MRCNTIQADHLSSMRGGKIETTSLAAGARPSITRQQLRPTTCRTSMGAKLQTKK